ncbi:MAG: SUMF1/EgtB/PvdO family nonheme iron enzyme [Candidatus Competibacter sp.]|nr:SUMF1/EgtB/PvdO family nonheme iron enzyme [Candidatus Competibacter sp.]
MCWGERWCWQGLLLVALAVLVPLTVEAAERVALVIGNGGYAERPLKNPPNDARAMAALLRTLEFTVTEKTDLDLRGFRAQVNAFLDQSKEAELRLIYYSGHGANYESDNYLLPIGHGVTHDYELPDQAYSVKTLLRGLKHRKGISVVLLDSCRNAPYSGDTKSLWDDSKGMKPLQPNQTGVLIGYAADQGQTASDNSSGSNSLYTKHLLKQLGQPRGLRDILAQVRQGVYAESYNQQFPMTEDRLLGDVYLAEPPSVTAPVASRQAYEPELARISGGCFQMGSPASEPGRSSDERQHQVCVEAFEIGVYEVTQGQWKAVMGSNPSDFKNGDDYPVENVSWNDIQDYLGKLNQRTGQSYRLPSEAEWEYACRGGVAGQRYCGGEDVDRVAWYGKNSGNKTHPVGRKAANGFGLYDLSGNVWEWTCSVYDEDYGGAEQNCANNDITGPLAVRGGSWFSKPVWVRSAFRTWSAPTDRDSYLGFRLARSL